MKAPRKIWPWLCWPASIVYLLGVAVRLSVKDTFPGVSALYYGTPLLVLTGLAGLAALGWFARKSRAGGFLFLIVTLASLWWWHAASFVDRSTGAGASDIRVLCWNTAHGTMGWPDVIKAIQQYDPDVIGLVEADSDEQADEFWDSALPGYTATDKRGGLVCLVRGTIHSVDYSHSSEQLRYMKVEVELRGRRLNILLVDIDSNPFISRRHAIAKLGLLSRNTAGSAWLVMGDFNTPGDSTHFDTLRSDMVNAFEVAGDGYAPTWPVPMPVLQIDHVWVSNQVPVTRCEAGWTRLSDHRPIVVSIDADWPD